MSAPSFRCAQCGAAIDPPADARLIDCPFCGSALAVAGSDLVFRQTLQATVTSDQALGHLRRFFAGTQTVSGLDRDAQIVSQSIERFPFWTFTLSNSGRETTTMMPAAPSTLIGLQGLALPMGAAVDPAKAGTLREPEVLLETARRWLQTKYGAITVSRTVLTYLPVHQISYRYKNRDYRAAVDAVSGSVFPADYPAKRETPFYLVAFVAAIVFLSLGLWFANPVLKLMVFAVAAVPLWLTAWFVARHV